MLRASFTRNSVGVVMHWRGLVDSLVLALVIYLVLRWGREARAFRVSLAIVALRVGAVVARQLGLSLTVWILDAATLAALIVILIVFQAELRRALVRLDVMAWLLPQRQSIVARSLQAVATAAFSLAHARRGALIVVAGDEPLDEIVEGGVPLGGAISTEILEAIFRKVSPVHDGATIIEGDHIARVSALLPLTQRRDVPRHHGTRHRAAMGLAERSDALVIVVSEERGEVSLASGRDMVVLQTPDALMQAIRQQREPGPIGRTRRMRQVLLGDLALKAVALGLAALVWASSVLLTGGSVRSVTVPVELSNVPADLEVSSLSTQTLQAQLRGPAWILESANLTTLVARFDLAGAGEGPLTLNVRGASVNFPPGVVLESVIPQTLSLRLVRRSQTPGPPVSGPPSSGSRRQHGRSRRGSGVGGDPRPARRRAGSPNRGDRSPMHRWVTVGPGGQHRSGASTRDEELGRSREGEALRPTGVERPEQPRGPAKVALSPPSKVGEARPSDVKWSTPARPRRLGTRAANRDGRMRARANGPLVGTT